MLKDMQVSTGLCGILGSLMFAGILGFGNNAMIENRLSSLENDKANLMARVAALEAGAHEPEINAPFHLNDETSYLAVEHRLSTPRGTEAKSEVASGTSGMSTDLYGIGKSPEFPKDGMTTSVAGGRKESSEFVKTDGKPAQGSNATSMLESDPVKGTVRINDGAVAIGPSAGIKNQKANAVAVGFNAGQTGQKASTVAVGHAAGLKGQGQYSVAIGHRAGQELQGVNAIAIGYNAGKNSQGQGGVIISGSREIVDSQEEGHVILASSKARLSFEHDDWAASPKLGSNAINLVEVIESLRDLLPKDSSILPKDSYSYVDWCGRGVGCKCRGEKVCGVTNHYPTVIDGGKVMGEKSVFWGGAAERFSSCHYYHNGVRRRPGIELGDGYFDESCDRACAEKLCNADSACKGFTEMDGKFLLMSTFTGASRWVTLPNGNYKDPNERWPESVKCFRKG